MKEAIALCEDMRRQEDGRGLHRRATASATTSGTSATRASSSRTIPAWKYRYDLPRIIDEIFECRSRNGLPDPSSRGIEMNFENLLITGGAGFVGSNLAIRFRRLGPDATVTALDNLKRRGSELNLPRLREAGVKFRHGDIRCVEDFGSSAISTC